MNKCVFFWLFKINKRVNFILNNQLLLFRIIMQFEKLIFLCFILASGSLIGSHSHHYPRKSHKHACSFNNYSRSSSYLTSTTRWSYADGYYVIHPNDHLFYYPFPEETSQRLNQEISWVTYEDPYWERSYQIKTPCDQIKENGLALMATCIQNLRLECGSNRCY